MLRGGREEHWQEEQRTCPVVTGMDPDVSEWCGVRKKKSAWQNGEKDDSGEEEAHTFLLGVRRRISKSGAKWPQLFIPLLVSLFRQL